jgi:hypothetical protein
MNIWGRYKRKAPELIDSSDKSNSASFLVSEYQLAFGSDWVIWAGRRKDEPK